MLKDKTIDGFSTTRDILADIYNYGFNTRQNYLEQGFVNSIFTYDKTLGRLRDLYFTKSDTQILERNTENGEKSNGYKFRRDYFTKAGEQLAAVFGLAPIKDEEIFETVKCLSIVCTSDGVTAKKVDENGYLGNQCYTTTFRRLKDLKDNGYLVQKDHKRYFADSTLNELCENELLQLYFLASFFAGTGCMKIPALFLKRAICRYLIRELYKQNSDIPCDILPEVFLFRDDACGNVLDEHIVYELLKCCREHRNVKVHRKLEKGVKDDVVAPITLRFDTRMGRWYLLCLHSGRPRIFRVSYIKNITPLDVTFDYESAKRKVDEKAKFTLFSGLRHEYSRPAHIRAEFHFADTDVREQFEREIVTGHIEHQKNGKEYYCAKVTDTSDLKPFLRSYGAHLKLLTKDSRSIELASKLQSEYKRMLEHYEGMLKHYETV